MKKLFLFISTVFLVLSFITFTSSSANASNFVNVEFSSNCSGFSISGAAEGNWIYPSWVVSYSLSISYNNEIIPAEGEITLESDNVEPFTPIAFEINDIWPQEFCGEIIINGTVEFKNGSYVADSITLEPETLVCPCISWCPRTPGYWKNHPENWPVDSLTIGNAIYSQNELLEMLKMPVKGDINVILIKHLIAAKLNVFSGFNFNEQIFIDADNYLANGLEDKFYAEGLKDILDEFNNSGDCD